MSSESIIIKIDNTDILLYSFYTGITLSIWMNIFLPEKINIELHKPSFTKIFLFTSSNIFFYHFFIKKSG